jgi:hypothetical protein
MLKDDLSRWDQTAPSEATAGLWAATRERDEWRHVLELASGRQAVVLSGDGAAQVLFPQMVPSVAASLIHGQTTGDEVRRTLNAIRRAGVIIIPEVANSNRLLASWPRIREALSSRPEIYDDSSFTVYGQARRPAGGSDSFAF